METARIKSGATPRPSGAGALLFWAAIAAAGLALVLVVAEALLRRSNAGLRQEIQGRQMTIDDGVRLSRTNEALIRSLAAAAVNNRDEAIRDLLAKNGLTVTVGPPAPAGAPAKP